MLYECFPESDHQLLTNHGFMFLDDVERFVGISSSSSSSSAAVVDWKGLKFASYNVNTQQLEYVEPLRLVVNEAGAELVELTSECEVERWSKESSSSSSLSLTSTNDGCSAPRRAVSIVATRSHQMFVRDARSSTGDYSKVAAEDLLSSASSPTDDVRLLSHARNGVSLTAFKSDDGDDSFDSATAQSSADYHSLACVQLLGLSRAQLSSFLELLGYFIAAGDVCDDECVRLPVHDDRQRRFVTERAADASVSVEHDAVLLRDARLVELFQTNGDNDDEVSSVDGMDTSRTGGMPRWILQRLERVALLNVLRGVMAARGTTLSSSSSSSFVVDTPLLRDQMLQLLLHAGYTGTFEVTPCARWRITYNDDDVERTQPLLRRRERQAVADSHSARLQRTWCVDLDDGFVVVRRAKRVAHASLPSRSSSSCAIAAMPSLSVKQARAGESFIVVQASRATIQGSKLKSF